MNLEKYFNQQSSKIERALDGFLPKAKERPAKLHEAMRYAVLGGGKRVRPILALAACETVGGDIKKVLPLACALELVHSYSLVHDDLPCMDDDDLRRGKPTCHKKYGEDTALLVGDALLTLAFKILTRRNPKNNLKDLERQLTAVAWIAEAIGTRGMVGGQAVDIEFQNKDADLATLQYINVNKSGALIAVALRAGAYIGGANPRQVEALYRYGKHVGLLFQIIDDILDHEGYSKLMGIAEAREHAANLLTAAQKELKLFGHKAGRLNEIANFIYSRKN